MYTVKNDTTLHCGSYDYRSFESAKTFAIEMRGFQLNLIDIKIIKLPIPLGSVSEVLWSWQVSTKTEVQIGEKNDISEPKITNKFRLYVKQDVDGIVLNWNHDFDSYDDAYAQSIKYRDTNKNLVEMSIKKITETTTISVELKWVWTAPAKKKEDHIYDLYNFTVTGLNVGLHGLRQLANENKSDKNYWFTGILIGRIGEIVVSSTKTLTGENCKYNLIAQSEKERGIKEALLMLLPEIK
jgi:hypothetical protein